MGEHLPELCRPAQAMLGPKTPGTLGQGQESGSDGQACAALGTTPLEHQTPVFGRHARPESVGALALEIAGLECAFHLGLTRRFHCRHAPLGEGQGARNHTGGAGEASTEARNP